MKIYAINEYNCKNSKKQNFSSKLCNLDVVMQQQQVPVSIKRTLSKLVKSVPFFKEATQYVSKSDLIRFAQMYAKAKTNILDLALKGKLKVIQECNGVLCIKDLFSLGGFINSNKKLPSNKRKGLCATIMALPILKKVEEDLLEEYPKDNMYPRFIKLKSDSNTDKKRKKNYEQEDFEDVAYSDSIRYGTLGSENLDKGNKFVIWGDERIRGKNDIIPRYIPTSRDFIGAPTSEIPKNVSYIFNSLTISNKAKQDLYTLSAADYFYDLAKNTSVENLLALAKLNTESDNMLLKMFNKDIMLNVHNPETDKFVELPVIDQERLVADKKYRLIKEDDLMDILSEHTLALAICRTYTAAKEKAQTGEVTKMLFDHRSGKLFQQVDFTKDDDSDDIFDMNNSSTKEFTRTQSRKKEDAAKILDYLNKIPQKLTFIKF